MLRESLISKEQEFREVKGNLENEFERKSMKIIEETRKIDPDEKIIQENDRLRERCDTLEKEAFKKTKEIEFLHRETKSLQG
jgi:hypothetical protein